MDEETKKRVPQKISKPPRSAEYTADYYAMSEKNDSSEKKEDKSLVSGNNGDRISDVQEEMEWTDEDIEILKKQLLKHTVGKLRGWEIITEAFMNEALMAELDEKAGGKNGEKGAWSSAEDIALLKALKAAPKDVPLRWEKISASVEGKSKQACMQRVAELKKGFRTAKAADGVQ